MSIDLVVANQLGATAQAVTDQTGNTSDVYLTQSGPVGINQPNPVAQLDIKGTLALNDNEIMLRAAADTYHRIGYATNSDSDYWIFNSALLLQKGPVTSPTNLLRLTSGTLSLPTLQNRPATGSADLTIDSSGNVTPQTSSVRFKTDVTPLHDNFSKVLALQPKAFRYKEGGDRAIGYLAEDVADLELNDLVAVDASGAPLSVHYKLLPVYILEVVKRQQEAIDELREELERLRTQREVTPS